MGQTCARLSDVYTYITALDPQVILFQIKLPKLEQEEKLTFIDLPLNKCARHISGFG